jgi:hypothetical protein
MLVTAMMTIIAAIRMIVSIVAIFALQNPNQFALQLLACAPRPAEGWLEEA